MRRYDVIFLDAQGTLLQPKPSLVGIYGSILRRSGAPVSDSQIIAAVGALWGEYRASLDSETASFDTSDELTRLWWADFNGRLLARLGIEGDRQAALDALWAVFGQPEAWDLFPEVREVLRGLRSRAYRLGIVSNWDSRLFAICEHHGLSSLLDFVVASAPTGMEKPDRRIFEAALARAEAAPDRALHVGDDYFTDIVGARRAGIDAVLIDRDGRSSPPDPVTTIRSLRELLAILDETR